MSSDLDDKCSWQVSKFLYYKIGRAFRVVLTEEMCGALLVISVLVKGVSAAINIQCWEPRM